MRSSSCQQPVLLLLYPLFRYILIGKHQIKRYMYTNFVPAHEHYVCAEVFVDLHFSKVALEANACPNYLVLCWPFLGTTCTWL